MKSLFRVSDKVLLKMLNGLFQESYTIEDTEITLSNSEFVKETLQVLRGDLFIQISRQQQKHHYHIEFQTQTDKQIIIRMFEYGFQKGKELRKGGRRTKKSPNNYD